MKKKTLKDIRLIFMGTSAFAGTILETLKKNNAHILTVYTQTEKPVGRKQIKEKSPVGKIAEKYSLPNEAPEKLDEAFMEKVKSFEPDVIVVAAYGKILPEKLLNLPTFGALNVHGSILPKYRGASPIQSAIMNNEEEAGITLIKMDAGVDTGDILTQATLKIHPQETAEDLEKRLAELGAVTLLETLPGWVNGEIEACPQNSSQASYCSLLKRSHGQIDWQKDASLIFCQYRACAGWPEVFTNWDNKRLKLKKISLALPTSNQTFNLAPGTVFSDNDLVYVATPNGAIILEEVQLEGKKNVNIKDFVRGYKNFIGSRLK